jgi:tetratricopeptide (TPR) repeat protein
VLGGAAVVLIGIAAATLAWRPEKPQLKFARALAALDAKRYQDVPRELEGLQGAEGFEPHRSYLEGELLLHQGQPFPALNAFGRSVNHAELRVRSLTSAGRALYQLRRFYDSIGLLNQAIEADPRAVEAHRLLASAYYDLGLTRDAENHLLFTADLAPDDPRPHRLLGLMYKDFENYDDAIRAYEESLRRSAQQSDVEEIRLELAECLVKQRRFEDALATLAPCPPSDQRAVLEAESLYNTGKSDEARRLLQQTAENSPGHLAALMLLGTIQMESGEGEAAAATLADAVTAHPKDYTARFKLVQAYRRLGKTELAEEHAAEAEKLKELRLEFSKLHETAAAEPQNAEVRCRLAVLAGQMDRPDLARVWYQAALAIDPANAQALEALGAPR